MSGGSDGQPAGSATTVKEACEGCTRAVHESGTSGARRCTRGARDYTVVHEIAECAPARVVHDGARDYVVSARDYGVVHDGKRVEVPTARQREMLRQLRKLVSGAREQCTRVVRVEHGGARECTRLRSGAQDCGVVHDGAREVHEIA